MTLSLGLAIYGAALSTLLAYQAYKSRQRNAEVQITHVIGVTGHWLRVSVIGGSRPTTIQAIGLLLNDEFRSHSQLTKREPYPDLPVHLVDGETVVAFFDDPPEGIWGAYAIDMSGNTYRTRMNPFPWWKARAWWREHIVWPYRRWRIKRRRAGQSESG